MKFDHIKPEIKESIQLKMFDLINLCNDSLISEFNHESISEPLIENISGVFYSGFIPFQDGGFQTTQLYRNDLDSSYHFNSNQTNHNNILYTNLIKDFIDNNDLKIEPENFDYESLDQSLQNEFAEFEINYYEPALISVYIYASNTKQWNNNSGITIQLSINYKDSPYYREQYNENLMTLEYSFSQFSKIDNKQIINLLKNYNLKKAA